MRVLFALAALLVTTLAFAQDYAAPGQFDFTIVDKSLTDPARQNRDIPIRIYLPKTDQKLPILIFSHGLGGNRETYLYFAKHMASHGYLCVHIQHRGSDTDAMKAGEAPMEAFRKAAADLRNALNRPKDVSFTLDQLTEMNKPSGELAGRLDLDRIAIAGHSFGAYTAMAVAGQGENRLRDPRVKSAIAMSAPAPKAGTGYSAITIPTLIMTGTLDNSPVTGGTAESRIQAFEQLTKNERYLVVFTGGDHMIFSGGADLRPLLGMRGMDGDRGRDSEFQTHIKALSLAFLQHTLLHDAKAQQWLSAPDGAKASLANSATWTVRAAK